MNILIIGSGFIGYNLAIGFHESDYNIAIVDKKVFPRDRYSFSFYNEKIKSPKLDSIFEKEIPDVVYYLIDEEIGNNLKHPLYLDTSLFVNVLQLCVKHLVKKIILVSWYSLSPTSCNDCLSLGKYQLPVLKPYLISKFSNELYCQYFKEEYGLDFVSLRMSKVYGYRKFDFWSDNIVDTLIRFALGKIRSTPKSLNNLNLLYIGDAISSLIFSLRSEISGIYNVVGKDYTYDDILKVLFKLIPVKLDIPRSSFQGVDRVSRMNFLECCGWEPIVSLDAGIQVTYKQITSKDNF